MPTLGQIKLFVRNGVAQHTCNLLQFCARLGVPVGVAIFFFIAEPRNVAIVCGLTFSYEKVIELNGGLFDRYKLVLAPKR
ncbi:hypothetical protein D3C86_1465320 [compost metagenome]